MPQKANLFATAMSKAQADTEGKLFEPQPLTTLPVSFTHRELRASPRCGAADFATNVKVCRTLPWWMIESSFMERSQSSIFAVGSFLRGKRVVWIGVSHGSSMGICRGVPMILEDLLVKPSIVCRSYSLQEDL
jgi:hypothetical protein